MARLISEDLIKRYYDEVKHKYPNIPYNTFRSICRNPFNFIKFCMAMPHMPTINIKFFGKFRVFPQTFNSLLKLNDKNFKYGHISEEKHLNVKDRYQGMQEIFQKRYDYVRNIKDDEELELND